MNPMKLVVETIKCGLVFGLCVALSGCDDDEVGQLRDRIERLDKQLAESEASKGNLRKNTDLEIQKAREECAARVKQAQEECEARVTSVRKGCDKEISDAKEESLKWKKAADYWKEKADGTDTENTALWWSIPMLLVGALAGGTFMGLKTRADVKKKATNAKDFDNVGHMRA